MFERKTIFLSWKVLVKRRRLSRIKSNKNDSEQKTFHLHFKVLFSWTLYIFTYWDIFTLINYKLIYVHNFHIIFSPKYCLCPGIF